MNKAQQASVELRAMDELAAQDSPMHRLSPLSKLFVTVLYIVVTVSFHKYDISGVFVMVLFPHVGYQVSLLPRWGCSTPSLTSRSCCISVRAVSSTA